MTFPPRLGTPGTTYDYNAQDGTLATLTADADGLLCPTTANEVALCDALGLPVVEEPTPAAIAEGPSRAQLLERAIALAIELPRKATKAQIADAIAIEQARLSAASTEDGAPAPDTTEQAGTPAEG